MKTWKHNPYWDFSDDFDIRTTVAVIFKGTTLDTDGTETPIEEQVTIESDATSVPFEVIYETLMQTFADWKTNKLGDA